jgi:hypothetical protein
MLKIGRFRGFGHHVVIINVQNTFDKKGAMK